MKKRLISALLALALILSNFTGGGLIEHVHVEAAFVQNNNSYEVVEQFDVSHCERIVEGVITFNAAWGDCPGVTYPGDESKHITGYDSLQLEVTSASTYCQFQVEYTDGSPNSVYGFDKAGTYTFAIDPTASIKGWWVQAASAGATAGIKSVKFRKAVDNTTTKTVTGSYTVTEFALGRWGSASTWHAIKDATDGITLDDVWGQSAANISELVESVTPLENVTFIKVTAKATPCEV